MKVSGYSPIHQVAGARKRGKISAAGEFSHYLAATEASGSESATPTQQAQAVLGLNPMFAAQEIPEEEIKRKHLIIHGYSALDSLEKLRDALLMGMVPPHVLHALHARIAEQKERVSDPKLMDLIADIELRVAVELAKLEQCRVTHSSAE